MSTGNPVDAIAGLRAIAANPPPLTVGFLRVPLTPARDAALAAFELRTGIPAQQLAADLLDDVIFNKGEN